MEKQDIERLAREYVRYANGGKYPIDLQMQESDAYLAFKWLAERFFLVSKDFAEEQRLIIEYDKKQMLEKPTGEKIALAGVYQAKLELMDKLFDTELFKERSEK